MTYLDIEFSGMIAFDLRKNKAREKRALLLPGEDPLTPHIPVLALPRAAVEKLPPALKRPNGWPQGLEHGGAEQILLDLTGLDLLVKGTPDSTSAKLDKVWALGDLNRLSGGNGVIRCGAETARVVMTGGLLEQGHPYPPFDTARFALTTNGQKPLPNTVRSLTNTMRWSGGLISLTVRSPYGGLGEVRFKDSGTAARVQAAVYCLVATASFERDSLKDFTAFYSLLSDEPPKRAYPIQSPEPAPLIEGYPRCIPPVKIV